MKSEKLVLFEVDQINRKTAKFIIRSKNIFFYPPIQYAKKTKRYKFSFLTYWYDQIACVNPRWNGLIAVYFQYILHKNIARIFRPIWQNTSSNSFAKNNLRQKNSLFELRSLIAFRLYEKNLQNGKLKNLKFFCISKPPSTNIL